MAYFGRKPKEPTTVPGSASGGTTQDRAVRAVAGAVERVLDRARPSRPGRANRAVRAARGGRSAR